MDKQYWHAKWQQLDIGFNQTSPNVLLQKFLPQFGLTAGMKIFVPLCGKTVDMLWLLEQGYEVIGVELSPLACEAFFKDYGIQVTVTQHHDFIVYKNHDKKITLFCGDFFGLNREILGHIDLIYDRAALIALPEEVRFKYVNHLINLFDLETKIFLITTHFDQSQIQGPPFSVGEHEVHALYPPNFTIQQLYNKPIQSIAAHLKTKGLMQAHEQAYVIVCNTPEVPTLQVMQEV